MKSINFEVNPRKVANLLKKMVNQACEDGFLWYPEVDKAEASIPDIVEAINILESADIKKLTITE